MSSFKSYYFIFNALIMSIILSLNKNAYCYEIQEQNVPIEVISNSNHVKKDHLWSGRYLPERPNINLYPDKPHHFENEEFSYSLSKSVMKMPTMGYMDINSTCDDGKTNLTMDWDESMYNYTCLLSDYLPILSEIEPLLEKDLVPKYYVANHVCMKENISYNHDIPSFGSHRPAWARYGEYKFLPKQRWLHNLEHGSVVMLYHPCAHPVLVQRMRTILKSCLFRHIITPYNLVPEKRPIVLVTWGNRLYMNDVDTKLSIEFIKKYANHAKETTARDGQYGHLLIEKAEVISPDDVTICPTPHKRKNRI